MKESSLYIGLDIGSISVNAVLMTAEGTVSEEHYCRTHGKPLETALTVLRDLLSRTPQSAVAGIAVTGSGGGLVAEVLNCFFVNEIIAQSTATARLHPDIRSVIEIGGEDSKLLLLEPDPKTGALRLKDVELNTVCAAGTGSFLDQQAARLGVSIEKEFGRLALKSTHPPRIAGRCSVFAKSDMIHLQQVATPDYDIFMGLCLAMARNFKSNLAGGAELEQPIAFQGGVAANQGMVRAFETVFELAPGSLVIPRRFAAMGAIGAVLALLDKGAACDYKNPDALEAYVQSRTGTAQHHDPLPDDGYLLHVQPLPVQGREPVDAYLGVDVGSISTNLVVIDRDKRVIARRYLMTAGRPIEAVRQGLKEVGDEIGNRVVIKGVTVTGSGRYLIGDFIGADKTKNEITAHARGAVNIHPEVDTIFEIGGQDSKYIRIENGAVVDFTMNKVCAAGTGSFLEEQAEKLGVSIKEEFGRLALSARSPICLGERCTVFMESSLNHHQQLGSPKDDLIGGLSYSIVLNYLNRVVEDRPVGNAILFQGGTAYNRGVKAAFEKVCGKKIHVPPHHDVLGALGCALIALEECPDGPSQFKGFDLARRTYTVESFDCHDCPNACEIRRVSIKDEPPLYYGSRCGKFDEKRSSKALDDIPRLFAEREQFLMADYGAPKAVSDSAPLVGIPRTTLFFETFPFWKAFLNELGFRIALSAPTSRKTITTGCETVMEEICFPIKVAHGHILDLLEKKVDYLLLPCVVNMEPLSTEAETAYNCLFVQSLPYLTRAAIDYSRYTTRVLTPVVHLEWGRKAFEPQLRSLAKSLGKRGPAVTRAIDAACSALRQFQQNLARRGQEVLAGLPDGRPALVIVSRPYNGCDNGLNLRIPDKLRDLGAVPIPLDFLPVQNDLGSSMQSMYWRYGQRIISAARTISRDPRLHAVYITNFSCGPDSFITKYFNREMGRKPWLTLELDEHSADAGIITRLEAFLDSLAAPRTKKEAAMQPPFRPQPKKVSNHRKVYVPYMDDHGVALAAAMRFYGIDAEALPMADDSTVEIGRRYTSGRECYPCIITTGDIIKKTRDPDFNPARSSFFMPSAMGPCRFGQYNRFHRMVLDDLGLHDVEMVVLDQTTTYGNTLKKLGTGFRRMGWQSLVLIDYLQKLLLQTRPYEINPGDSDRVYRDCLEQACRALEQDGRLNGCSRYAVDRFSSVEADRSRSRPLIGIVGEIFVRSNRFSNNFIIRAIEELGGEVVIPTMQEWVQYTDWERRKDLRREGTLADYTKEVLTGMVQQHYVRKIGKPFKGTIKRFHREVPTGKVMNLCDGFLNEHIRGEANLSLGRAVEYALHNFSGIVNLSPFNCMPGTIVSTLLHRFTDQYPRIPVLKMVYDGTAQSGDQTRIEAFMHQAHQVQDS